MPARLRPTAPLATDAIVVGDPGRALLLAQALLKTPKMSNHARGLWGYSGLTPEGKALTIQSTGIGGPSAALVLTDLAELGVRRAVRVGTCTGLGKQTKLGELLLVDGAIATGGSAAALGASAGETVAPDAALTAHIGDALEGTVRVATVCSVDAHPGEKPAPAGAMAADMQTAPLLARARALQVEVAALLIVTEARNGEALDDDALEQAEKRAGRLALAGLST
jgi:uridine phosphorylase